MARRRSTAAGRANWLLRLVGLCAIGVLAYFARPWLQEQGLEPRPAADQNSESATKADPAANSGQEVLVEHVVDGDTLVISGGDRVRLIGVDTPETHHPTKPVQPFGPEAYEFTRSIVEGKRVVLQFDPRETKDRYGRTLAYVYVDGQFLNELLLLNGYARALTSYPFRSDMKERFRSAEAQAKTRKRGIWSLEQSPIEVTSGTPTKKAG